MLKVYYTSSLETFDIKFILTTSGGTRHGDKLDARVKFEDGKPILLLVKKNDNKIVVFDTVCLHR